MAPITHKHWLMRAGTAGLLAAVGLSLSPMSAVADDAPVARRLAKHGKLSDGDAKRLIGTVSGRMKRGADMTNNADPLRVAISTALYNAPVPPDAMAAAKIRLRLYAGLSEWALEKLFAPRPGAMANCSVQFGLPQPDCAALIAAGGRVSLADASRLGAGAPTVTMAAAPSYPAPQAAYGQPRPAYAPQQPAYGQPQPAYAAPQRPRFGQFNSGYAAQPAYGAQPVAAPAWKPSAAAAPQQRPVAGFARPAAAAPNPALVASRKAEYERQRQAYLERKRQEMGMRKEKVVATAGGTTSAARGPSSAEEAAVVGLPPPPPSAAHGAGPAASAKASGKAPPAAGEPAVTEEAPAEAPPAGAELGADFLDGLVADPLGKKK